MFWKAAMLSDAKVFENPKAAMQTFWKTGKLSDANIFEKAKAAIPKVSKRVWAACDGKKNVWGVYEV